MQSQPTPFVAETVVILGTGGTIAGTAARPQDTLGYRAAQLPIADLVAAVPALAGLPLETEQLAQVDSKDMDAEVWGRLLVAVERQLQRPEVQGLVVTHGSDTLEETAYLLQRVLAPSRPVVLTAAMRPATALLADGPQNLLDAVRLAREPGACGVLAVLAGRVFEAAGLRKAHSHRLDAFEPGEAGLIGEMADGRLRRFRAWPQGPAIARALLRLAPEAWPRVEIVCSHAGADGRIVDALLAQGLDGLVVACTGNGTLHRGLESALQRAQQAGVAVLRTSRCAEGGIVEAPTAASPFESAGALSPQQARVELLLRGVEGGRRRPAA